MIKNFLNKFKWFILGGTIVLSGTVFAVQVSVPSGNGAGFLLQSLSTGNYGAVSLVAGSNVTISTTTTSITISSSGGGGTFPFTSVTGYNSTSTTLGLLNGFFSTASSTFGASAFFPSLSQGFAGIGTNGLLYTFATSSIKTSQLTNDAGFTTNTGTLTAVSVASSNGFAGSSSGGATPVLTLSTTISGVLKGDGTAISAASNGTDYTLITAKDCTGTGHVLSVTATGTFNCSADSGTGGSSDSFTHPAVGQSATTSLMLLNGNASTTGLSTNYAFIGGTATTSISALGVVKLGTTTAGCLQNDASGVIWSATCAGGGSVTSVVAGAGFQNQGLNITSSGTLVGAFATSATPTLGGLPYFTGVGSASLPATFGVVATSTLSATSPLTGSFTQIGSGGTLGCQTASGSQAGCLSSTDWNTFNTKPGFPFTVNTGYNSTTSTIGFITGGLFSTASSTFSSSLYLPSLTQGSLFTGTNGLVSTVATGTVSAGSSAITVTAGRSVLGGALSIDCAAAGAAQNGCLSSANFTIFNNKLGAYDPFTHPQLGFSATTSSMVFGTSTAATNIATLTLGSTTASQIGLFADGNVAGWTMRNAGGDLSFSTTTVAGNATTTKAAFTITNGGQYSISTSTSGNLAVNTNGLIYATAAGAGTVTSITASTPNSTLTLGGTNPVTTSGTISFDLNLGNANKWTARQEFNGNASSTQESCYGPCYFGGTATTTITNAGLVGVGTSTPWANLSINAPSQSAPFFAIGSSTATLLSVVSANYAQYGLGTSTPYGTLAVQTPAGFTGDQFNVGSSSKSAFRIDGASAIFAPNTASSGSSQTGYWCYDGNGQLIRDTAVCLVSARKFKTDIKPLTLGLTDFLKLTPVSYVKKDPLSVEDSHTQMGFIADDVAKISPQANEMLVTYVGGGTSGEVHAFRYDQFTSWITKAIQDFYKQFQKLVARVSGLEKRVNEQQKEIDSLQAQINALKK